MKTKGIKVLKVFLFCVVIVSFLGLNPISAGAFDEPGDFTVGGKVGIGTDDLNRKLNVNGSIQIPREDWEGIYFGSGPGNRALIWRQAYDSPQLVSEKLVIGRDGSSVQIMWDTFRDGQWGFCEGVPDNGNPSWQINCANYAPLMSGNDYYFIWKHGKDNRYPETGDLQFLFDGESNDGVMGFMEDEDAFFFNEKLGIGTKNPAGKLEVATYTNIDDNWPLIVRNSRNQMDTTSKVGIKLKLSTDTGNEANKWVGIKAVPEDNWSNLIGMAFYTQSDATAVPVEKMRIDNNGNVGIGTTDTQGYKLYVNGTAYFTGINQTSDAQFKKNIKPISSALDKVMNLKGVSYEWKTDEYKDRGFEDGRHYGVIAQDVETVLPEIVKENGDGYKGVSYTEMIPVLIEAVKEQQEMIATQQKEIKELKTEVNKLKTKGYTARALPYDLKGAGN